MEPWCTTTLALCHGASTTNFASPHGKHVVRSCRACGLASATLFWRTKLSEELNSSRVPGHVPAQMPHLSACLHVTHTAWYLGATRKLQHTRSHVDIISGLMSVTCPSTLELDLSGYLSPVLLRFGKRYGWNTFVKSSAFEVERLLLLFFSKSLGAWVQGIHHPCNYVSFFTKHHHEVSCRRGQRVPPNSSIFSNVYFSALLCGAIQETHSQTTTPGIEHCLDHDVLQPTRRRGEHHRAKIL